MDIVKTLFDFVIHTIFGEAFSVFFLLGALLALVGLALIVLFTLSRLLGYRTTGTVSGAVEVTRIKRKQRDGETVEEQKTTLWPVYEYQTPDGSTRQMRGSEGGSMTTDYSTGQTVNLIVREDEDYDDVYDADRYGALYLGLSLSAFGIGLMMWIGSAASALGMGILSLLFVLCVNGLVALLTRRRDNRPGESRKPYSKSFNPSDLKPVEHFMAT